MAHDNSKKTDTLFRRRLSLMLERMRDLHLLERRTETVTAQINPKLLQLAKERAGIEDTSTLVELALANLVAEDGFAKAFVRARGQVPVDIDIGFQASPRGSASGGS